MNAGDLIAIVRDESDDLVAPYLWSDATLIRYIGEAEMEAAVRARFFVDSTVTVKVKANTGTALLDPNIIYVRGARVIGNDLKLCPRYRRDMDRWPDWEDETGDALHFVKDYVTGKLRLHPMPTVDVVVRLTIVRGPLNRVASTGDDLEIPMRYQEKLANWALFRMYSKRDSGGDARDDKLAAYYEKQFDKWFGPPRNAMDEVFEQQQEDVLESQGGSY